LLEHGGREYARSTARELGIEALFVAFLPKPNVLIDDQDIGTRKRFTVVHPFGVLDTVEAYLAMLEPGVTTSPPDRR
jgi:hypothetical protein